MLNVNELTSRMAKMSDAQLRQYAQIHKNDPYTLALAASESKRRAQLRAGGQPQAGQQPTVADQALAQMGAPAPMPQPQLPEQQGIGMLPAENVAGMADGGIAGYGDSYADEYANGGIVAFAGADGSVVKDRMTPEEKAELLRYQKENFEGLYGLKDWASGVKKDVVDWFNADRSNIPFESKNPMIKYGTPKYTGIMEYERPEAALARERQERGIEPPAPSVSDTYPDEISRGMRSQTPTTTSESKTTPSTDRAKPGAGRGKAPGAGTTKDQQAGVVPAPDFVPSKPGDLTAELKRLQKMSPGTADYDKLNEKIKKGYADLESAREKDKPKDKAFAGLEALLGKEEEKAKGKEAKNFNMALVNAGLAIAGGKSQYALQNIAEGAQVGTKQYQEGLEKLEAAAVERRKQAAMIEESRRAEARGDWKDAQQFKQKAFEAGLGVEQAKIAAVQDLYKTDLKTATDIVNNQNTIAGQDRRTMYEQQQQTLRSREQNVSQLAGQRLMANAYAARAADRGAISPALLFKEYNDFRQKDTLGDFKKEFPTFQHYMYANQPISMAPVDKLPSDANVRK